MEINIVNIEDRHQEKAYAIWKAGIIKLARIWLGQVKTACAFDILERMEFAVEFQLFHLQIT